MKDMKKIHDIKNGKQSHICHVTRTDKYFQIIQYIW